MKVNCPKCDQKYDINSEDLGKEAECAICHTSFTLESPKLIKCLSCDKLVSKDAMACPNCGQPIFLTKQSSVVKTKRLFDKNNKTSILKEIFASDWAIYTIGITLLFIGGYIFLLILSNQSSDHGYALERIWCENWRIGILIGFCLFWGVGLSLPIILRYFVFKKPLSTSVAIGICAVLLLIWVSIGVLLSGDSLQSNSTRAIGFLVLISYFILRSEGSKINSTNLISSI